MNRNIKEKIINIIKTVFQFISNPRLLLCFGGAWFLTNGWAYIMLGLGTLLNVKWMMTVSGAYLALLWIPFTPEKIITVALSFFFLRLFFPNDLKTLGKLHELREKIRKKKI